jgi:serine/threonine-protein kinase RsbW
MTRNAMPAPAENVLDLDLYSTRDGINLVTERLTELFCRAGLSEDDTFDLKLAAQEAVVNAVEHGNECDETKQVHIHCESNGRAITLVVRDEGAGFNPDSVPDPTLPENILREHGRGLFLMRNLCDEVRFNAKGNEITMVKRIQ